MSYSHTWECSICLEFCELRRTFRVLYRSLVPPQLRAQSECSLNQHRRHLIFLRLRICLQLAWFSFASFFSVPMSPLLLAIWYGVVACALTLYVDGRMVVREPVNWSERIMMYICAAARFDDGIDCVQAIRSSVHSETFCITDCQNHLYRIWFIMPSIAIKITEISRPNSAPPWLRPCWHFHNFNSDRCVYTEYNKMV